MGYTHNRHCKDRIKMTEGLIFDSEKRVKFQAHLQAKRHSEVTQKKYMRFWDKLTEVIRKHGLDQGIIDIFVGRYNNSDCSAFARLFLRYYKIQDIEVPVASGRKQRKKRRYISPEEVDKIAEVLAGQYTNPKYLIMLYLTYYCALRRKEVVNIIPTDFDWETWFVDRNEPLILKISAEGAKGKKERFVLVRPDLADVIEEFIRQHQYQIRDDLPLFGIKEDRWQKVFKEAARKINEQFTLHGLRFSRATYWHNEMGKDIVEIKVRLGHRDISTTQLYINPEEEKVLMAWRKEEKE